MKYVILIHSNPQPWGHPTGNYNAGVPGAAGRGSGRRWTASSRSC